VSHEAVSWAMDDAPMLSTSAGKPDVTARWVLAVVAERADKHGHNAHPSIADIRYRTGLDRSTVQRALRRLEAAGLLLRDGSVGGRTRWRLAMDLRRPESDWAAVEVEDESDRRAVAERVRRHRAKAVTGAAPVTETGITPVTAPDVTASECVTNGDVTHSEAVTEPAVTGAAPVSNALNARYSSDVTHSAPVSNALNAARTVQEPSKDLTVLEPSGSETPPTSESPPGESATIDGQQSPPQPKRTRTPRPKPERTPAQQEAFDAADKIAHWWWDARCPKLGIPVKDKRKFPGFRSALEAYLITDPPCSPQELQQALEACTQSWPANTRFEGAIRDLRGKAPRQPSRPTNQHTENAAADNLAEVFG
jgi:DNA-binding Lrp family transcriptional regulator